MIGDDGLPTDWTQAQCRDEFVKWADVMIRLLQLESLPGGLAFWQQTRSHQSLLSRLAARLKFAAVPFVRRQEKFELQGVRGQEFHDREWLAVADPDGNTVEEFFYTWIACPDANSSIFQNRPAGFDDQFRRQVLAIMQSWKVAVQTVA